MPDKEIVEIKIQDSHTNKINMYFNQCHDFIEKARINNERIMVHCTAVLSYHMELHIHHHIQQIMHLLFLFFVFLLFQAKTDCCQYHHAKSEHEYHDIVNTMRSLPSSSWCLVHGLCQVSCSWCLVSSTHGSMVFLISNMELVLIVSSLFLHSRFDDNQ